LAYDVLVAMSHVFVRPQKYWNKLSKRFQLQFRKQEKLKSCISLFRRRSLGSTSAIIIYMWNVIQQRIWTYFLSFANS